MNPITTLGSTHESDCRVVNGVQPWNVTHEGLWWGSLMRVVTGNQEWIVGL